MSGNLYLCKVKLGFMLLLPLRELCIMYEDWVAT